MKKRPLARSIVALLFLSTALLLPAKEDLPPEKVQLSNQGVSLVIQPLIGARIVSLQFPGSGELLAPSTFPPNWRPEGSPRPPLNYRWQQDTGQIIWAGPQATWWSDNGALQQKRDRAVNWPPDPDWTLAAFQVLERSDTKIVLQSPVSRVTGLQLTKTVELHSDNSIVVHARAVNQSAQPVWRDLWFNFRAPVDGEEYVPVATISEDIRREAKSWSRVTDGLHTLALDPIGDKEQVYDKIFIKPAKGWFAYAGKGGFLIFEFNPPPIAKVAPGHSPVEIYRVWRKNGEAYLELETHSKYGEIPPGGSVEHEERWRFIPYSGEETAEARAKYLNEKLR